MLYYDGANRAENGANGSAWINIVNEDGDKIMHPGRLYMIALSFDAPVIRFKKKADAGLLTTTTSVSAYDASDATNANWNGVSNPALFHAYVNAGADDEQHGLNFGQVYNPSTNSYEPINMSTAKFVVGQGAFVQAPVNKSITVSYGGAYAAAPRRMMAAAETPLYDVRIAPEEGDYTDRLFVTTDDEKEADNYIIGKDLAKLGVSKQVAQIWVNRYDAQLCLNTMAPVNNVANYPLSLFAPVAGEYTISCEPSVYNDQYEMYLTRGGRAICELTSDTYTLHLNEGTTTNYGLRIVKAPEIFTGVDEAVVKAQGETRKVLINDKVFIIRGNNIYSIDGQMVK